MEMNGGFFGSMMPQGASSFMPQGPSGQSMIGGVGGTPNGLTSPPMGDGLMAALAKLATLGKGMQDSGGPSALPANSFSPWMENGGQPPQQPSAGGAAAGAPQGGMPGAQGAGSPMGGLNPDMIKALLQRLGIGGAKPPGM